MGRPKLADPQRITDTWKRQVLAAKEAQRMSNADILRELRRRGKYLSPSGLHKLLKPSRQGGLQSSSYAPYVADMFNVPLPAPGKEEASVGTAMEVARMITRAEQLDPRQAQWLTDTIRMTLEKLEREVTERQASPPKSSHR